MERDPTGAWQRPQVRCVRERVAVWTARKPSINSPTASHAASHAASSGRRVELELKGYFSACTTAHLYLPHSTFALVSASCASSIALRISSAFAASFFC